MASVISSMLSLPACETERELHYKEHRSYRVFDVDIRCCAESLQGCDDDDQSVKAATIAAQYSLRNYGSTHVDFVPLIYLGWIAPLVLKSSRFD